MAPRKSAASANDTKPTKNNATTKSKAEPKAADKPSTKIAKDESAQAKKGANVMKPARGRKPNEVEEAPVKAPVANTTKPGRGRKPKSVESVPETAPATAPAKPGCGRKAKSADEDVAEVPAAPTTTVAGTKRAASKTSPAAEAPSKRQKKAVVSVNDAPTGKLDIYVFGAGEQGELGLGSGARVKDVQRPRLNKNLDSKSIGVAQIAVGGMHCVALTHDGKILTWGVNDNYALGRDTAWEAPTRDADASDSEDDDEESGLNPRETTPTAIPSECFPDDVAGFSQVVATNSASFALTLDGRVFGWGAFSGNDGTWGFFKEDAAKGIKFQKVPALIPQLSNIKALASGGDHVLALDHKGYVFAWGCGEQSQLAHRVAERRRFDYLVPNPVALPKGKIQAISAGGYHGFAVDDKGQVWSWGLNNFGQTGISNGAGDDNAVIQRPFIVKALSDYKIKSIVGGLQHSIACTKDGAVLVWGRCDDGQMGVDLTDVPKENLLLDSREKPKINKEPVQVPDLKADFVAAGIDDCIAITTDGKAFSWGFSDGYRTGHGTDEPIHKATMIDNTAIREKKLTWAGCGGQFSVLAGPTVQL
ncbi:hypothetical protein HYALB_00009225 [Hymenoscyphus albidus]|uniref:RCC1-like domain-containing protein n=1 Tax=Hymenoscyphus albidus TaxID=595503 RepID=A0A9N9LFD4_9HELO|nr:hypothetical protein HYALB_00009225 [Hymenoscyphus albidus]